MMKLTSWGNFLTHFFLSEAWFWCCMMCITPNECQLAFLSIMFRWDTSAWVWEAEKGAKKYFFLTQKCGCFLFLPPSLKYNLNSTIFVKLWKGDLSPRIQQNPLTITSTSFVHYPENISRFSGAASWTEKRSSIKERIHHQQSWRTKFETRTYSLGTLYEGMKDWQLGFTHTGDFVITGNSLHMFTTQLNCCI